MFQGIHLKNVKSQRSSLESAAPISSLCGTGNTQRHELAKLYFQVALEECIKNVNMTVLE